MRMHVGRMMLGLVLIAAFAIAGCGGGGDGGGTASVLTVSGTASEGALITGKTVKLKDANGMSALDATTDAATGIYSINVTGLTAPFLVTVTGSNGTYVTLAPTAGTANINPITTTVVALAAGNPDVPALFTNLTPAQLTSINSNFGGKSELVTASLQAVLPPGVKSQDYFTGPIAAGQGMDAVFDAYRIAVHPTSGISIKTNDANATTVLTIPTSTVMANTSQPLPAIGGGSSVAPVPTSPPTTIPAVPLPSSPPAESVPAIVIPTVTLPPPPPPPPPVTTPPPPPVTTPPPPVLLSRLVTLKIYLTGALPASTEIGAVGFKLTFPANTTPATVVNQNDAISSVEPSGLFIAAKTQYANYGQATGTMNVVMIVGTAAGMTELGEIATVRLRFANGFAPTVDDFTLPNVSAFDLNGREISGINANAASVTVQ